MDGAFAGQILSFQLIYIIIASVNYLGNKKANKLLITYIHRQQLFFLLFTLRSRKLDKEKKLNW